MQMTNGQFAKTNEVFRASCKLLGIKPTSRQASKFRRYMGSAWAFYSLNRQRILKEIS